MIFLCDEYYTNNNNKITSHLRLAKKKVFGLDFWMVCCVSFDLNHWKMAISLLNYTHCQCTKSIGRVNHGFCILPLRQSDGWKSKKKNKMKNSLWKTESSVVLVRWVKKMHVFSSPLFLSDYSSFLLLSISHMKLSIFIIIMNCFCFRLLAICTFAHKCIFIGLSIAITNRHVHVWIFASLWDQLKGDRMWFCAFTNRKSY